MIVVIPVYKPFSALTHFEISSLLQCFSILHTRIIYIIGPANLDLAGYIQFAKANNININTEKFRNSYFKNISGYNKLLLSKEFYKRFLFSKFLLIYQLDAWVFSDQLDFWIKQNYDFVGAPLFERFNEKNNINFIKGCNGGLSLRSVQSSMQLIRKVKVLQALYFLTYIFGIFRVHLFNQIIKIFKLSEKYHIKSSEKLHAAMVARKRNEDYVWTKFLEEAFIGYKVPDSLTSLKFSFEVNSKYLYSLNNNQLPFGCHAWEKYEPEFWENFIKV